MSHKAGVEFFVRKLAWSQRKDQILESYLKRYLPTLAHRLESTRAKIQGITIVDGFAGPGKFQSGEDGSPLIICKNVAAAHDVVKSRTNVLCIERSDSLSRVLAETLKPYPFARVRSATFQSTVDELVSLAERRNLLLYLDPFTVDGLEWNSLDRLFHALGRGVSIEVLLNFNAPIFMRAGLSAMKLEIPIESSDDEEIGELEPLTNDGQAPGIGKLNEVAGGDWWQEIASDKGILFSSKVDLLVRKYCDKLRSRFAEVCSHQVFAKVTHKVPKYALIFGSRSPTALIYMNDAMVGARNTFASESRPKDACLFETLPESVVPDDTKLPDLIWDIVSTRMTRAEVTKVFVRQQFGRNTKAEIHGAIRSMLVEKRLATSSRSVAINDDSEIWRRT